jgi:hypothetical protein
MLERRKEAQKNAIFPFYPLFGFSHFLPSKAIPTSNYYLLFFIFRAVGYFFYFATAATAANIVQLTVVAGTTMAGKFRIFIKKQFHSQRQHGESNQDNRNNQ